MFGWFSKSRKVECPVPEDARVWLEETFQWLLSEFDKEMIMHRKVLRPIPADFPITFTQTEKDAHALLKIVAAQMAVNPDQIELFFYDQQLKEYGGSGLRLFSQQSPGEKYASGKYYGKNEYSQYQIAIELSELKDAGGLVATLAHEIAHIKLLGEERMKFNDEHLTELIPVIYGLGIFNANTAFRFYATHDSWGYKRQGYLSQQMWGYALALFAHIRKERDPEWVKYLTTNVRADFKKGFKFLEGNSGLRIVR
ncbi:hypothetical protein SAMN04488505_11475 [Chitinophaga rupis]|uniref:Uncharacterized protein n=1 Tax=Chitinophaga rupis TaxID=573321 RepID=A0A1H8KB43_9BACT|nr:hypothetical protein SAMN04488505_11475 [Chitinophaga rupis]